MINARIHLSPVSTYLTVTDTDRPSEPVLQKKVTLHLLRAPLPNQEDSNGFASVERVFGELLALIENHSAKLVRITAAADLANAEMLLLLRLFLKKLELPTIEILDFAAEFAQMQNQVINLPPECLAVVAGEVQLRFITIKRCQPEFILTLPCGVIALTHKYIKNDPPETGEIIALRDHLSAEFERLQWLQLPEKVLTFSDAGLALARLINASAASTEQIITKSQIQNIFPELSHTYRNQIARRPDADPDFAEYLLTAALLYEHLLEHLELEQVAVFPQ